MIDYLKHALAIAAVFLLSCNYGIVSVYQPESCTLDVYHSIEKICLGGVVVVKENEQLVVIDRDCSCPEIVY